LAPIAAGINKSMNQLHSELSALLIPVFDGRAVLELSR